MIHAACSDLAGTKRVGAVPDLQPGDKVTYAIGAIVLRCQDIEQLFKFVTPHIDGEAPDWTSRARRMDKLARLPLGEVAKKFVDAATGSKEALRACLDNIVDRRNAVVHHFGETYGHRVAAGQHDEVLAELRHLHQDATSLLCMLQEMFLAIAETHRDTVFVGTDEHARFAAMCADLRAAVRREH